MSENPTPAGPDPEEPERPRGPDRVFRETFLCRFLEEAAAHLERCGETLLTLAEVGGFLPSRGHERGRTRVQAQVLAVADDLEHLVHYLTALPRQPREGLSPQEEALRAEAAT